MAAIDKVRILVVGDSGVGKTSLVHLICHNQPVGNPGWTIGCSVEVKLHEYKVGTPAEKTYFLELWDIGGSTSHQNSRSIFYNPVHGVILVHDLTNRKSHQNLRKWLAEVLNKDCYKDTNGYDYDPEQFAGNQTPVLVVGTKADLAERLRENVLKRISSVAEECGADEINLLSITHVVKDMQSAKKIPKFSPLANKDCNQEKCVAPGSTNAVKLSRFFDKVIERKFYTGNQAITLHVPSRFLSKDLTNWNNGDNNLLRVVPAYIMGDSIFRIDKSLQKLGFWFNNNDQKGVFSLIL